ncbi:hypothetical protein G7Z17_g2948 [Cylindrodendrum hubeiense]|uniref:Nephrocystin 3-like N-terminal domain-containing protein n=1 Tax=Cylindrodendrum hubeiense TaxID=595255 RepID=A0A9P5HM30_9HYPO|nr:hypothetical protein G7Z17_g2948 [Cylindrodendrum hubeiense]
MPPGPNTKLQGAGPARSAPADWSADNYGSGTQSISTGSGAHNVNSGAGYLYNVQNQYITQSPPGPGSLRECQQSLAFLEMNDRPNDIDGAVEGTCEWLSRHETYRDWASRDRGLLWIEGKPGSGKSTLLKHVLRSVEADGDMGDKAIILSFFFHGRGGELQRKPLGLFRSLLHQLLVQVPECSPLLVDAFQQRCDTIGTVGEKWQWHARELPVFFESSAPAIADMITCQALGVVLWARLVVKRVLTLAGHGEELKIQAEIRRIPPDLDALYDGLIRSMESRAMSQRLIQWICISKVPLSIDQLRWAMAINPDLPYKSLQQCRESEEYTWDDETMERRIKTLSCGLAETVPFIKSRTVQFIHQSVKDFFMERGLLALAALDGSLVSSVVGVGRAHYNLCRICLRYMAMEEIAQRISSSWNDLESEFPLLGYAATWWVAHAKQGEVKGEGQDDLLQVFGWPSESLVQLWIRVYLKTVGYYSDEYPPEGTSLLHVVSRYELTDLLSSILHKVNQLEVDIDCRDGNGWTPLLWAASKGHAGIIELLLSTGKVNVDAKQTGGFYDITPLSWAVSNGDIATIKLLLDTGKVDVNVRDRSDYGQRTPLSWAASNRDATAVKLLLDTGKVDIDANVRDIGCYSHRTPLLWATSKGNAAVVKLLLDTGKVDVNMRDMSMYGHRTPLSWATLKRNTAVVKLLLDTDKVDVNVRDVNAAIVKLLLDTGKVDVDARDTEFDRTPLWLAATGGHEVIVKLLIDTGKVDVNARDKYGRMPLWVAVQRGYEAIVKLLLNTGKVDVDAKYTEFDQTPLLSSVKVAVEMDNGDEGGDEEDDSDGNGECGDDDEDEDEEEEET